MWNGNKIKPILHSLVTMLYYCLEVIERLPTHLGDADAFREEREELESQLLPIMNHLSETIQLIAKLR